MKYIIVGGAGFIGSHFIDLILQEPNVEVIVVDNFFLGSEENLATARGRFKNRLKVYKEDADNFYGMSNIIGQEKPDIVVNFATKALLYSFDNPAEAMKINVDIILNLLESLRYKKYDRLIHLSTSEVFGTAMQISMNEDHPIRPETTYAAGKAAADLTIQSYINMFELDVITLRPFNNYGPRQNKAALAAVIPITINRILQGLSPILEGDGTQTRDFIYVEDTVKIIRKFIEFNPKAHREFNIGTGEEISILKLVNNICEIMNYKGEFIKKAKRKADVARHSANIDRLVSEIGDLNLTSLSAGLERTVNWYQEKFQAD